MFDKVIWATDGSEFADEALPYAKRLASGEGHELVIVHSTERLVGGRGAGEPLRADEHDVQQKILQQVEDARAEGLTVTPKFGSRFSGHTAELIADIAREVDGDVIVVGTRGYGPAVGLIVGSVTQRLLHTAPCPVLAVPAGAAYGRRHARDAAKTAR
ncbi:MAG TPA: universal stress protein [Gaiellaceae bacterium]|nr:universal stress protein [Gaiellaceae bacterium]